MNFKIDTLRFTSNDPAFDGRRLWLSPSQFEEGAEYAKANNIKNFFIWRGDEELPAVVNLDLSWLSRFPDTFYLEIMPHLSKESQIDALYDLKALRYLVYFGYDTKPLNHHNLQSLKSLYTHYDIIQSGGDSSFELLPNLERLKLWHIKKQTDCHFLGSLTNVKHLELTWSKSIERLDGMEKLTGLTSISIHRCSMLKDISALLQCDALKGVWIESSKSLDLDAPAQLKARGVDIGGPPGSAISKI